MSGWSPSSHPNYVLKRPAGRSYIPAMGHYVEIDREGQILLRLPPEFEDRYAEIIEAIEDRFGFDGLTTDSERDIDTFVAELIQSGM